MIKSWSQFNEAIWPLSLFTSDFDKQINILFDKIKNRFDIEQLSYTNSMTCEKFEYNIEETDSDSGYIKIEVSYDYDYDYDEFTLHVDDEVIKCSNFLIKKIFKFFETKKNEKIKLGKINFLKNKIK